LAQNSLITRAPSVPGLPVGSRTSNRRLLANRLGGLDAGFHRGPVGLALVAFGFEDLAFADALRTRGRAHGVGGFKDAQRFGAGDQVGGAQRPACTCAASCSVLSSIIPRPV
jgi:hypothetical protein